MGMPYNINTVLFNPVFTEEVPNQDAKSIATSDLVGTQHDLFFGSWFERRRRVKSVMAALGSNQSTVNLTSDMLYVVLAENGLDDSQTQLVLLNLIENNAHVREFFLNDIFGNADQAVSVKDVKMPGEESISFERLSPEVLQSYLGQETYEAYRRDRRTWIADPANKETIDRIIANVSLLEVQIRSKDARDTLFSKLFTDIDFGYSFFSRWNILQQVASPNPQTLLTLSKANPGAALAILMNDHLSQGLKEVLTTDDKVTLLRNAAEQTSFGNRRHYFRVTLTKLLPLTQPDELNIAEFLRAAPFPLDLLEELVMHANAEGNEDESNLHTLLSQQAGRILTEVNQTYRGLSGEIAKLMSPFVTNLIDAYDQEKTAYQKEQIESLFNDHRQLIEPLALHDETLGKIAPADDETFVSRHNPNNPANKRRVHWWKSFLNRAFGAYEEFFQPEENHLNLQQQEAAAAEEPVVPPAAEPAQEPVPAPVVENHASDLFSDSFLFSDDEEPVAPPAAEPVIRAHSATMELEETSAVTVHPTTMELEEATTFTVHPATMELEETSTITVHPTTMELEEATTFTVHPATMELEEASTITVHPATMELEETLVKVVSAPANNLQVAIIPGEGVRDTSEKTVSQPQVQAGYPDIKEMLSGSSADLLPPRQYSLAEGLGLLQEFGKTLKSSVTLPGSTPDESPIVELKAGARNASLTTTRLNPVKPIKPVPVVETKILPVVPHTVEPVIRHEAKSVTTAHTPKTQTYERVVRTLQQPNPAIDKPLASAVNAAAARELLQKALTQTTAAPESPTSPAHAQPLVIDLDDDVGNNQSPSPIKGSPINLDGSPNLLGDSPSETRSPIRGGFRIDLGGDSPAGSNSPQRDSIHLDTPDGESRSPNAKAFSLDDSDAGSNSPAPAAGLILKFGSPTTAGSGSPVSSSATNPVRRRLDDSDLENRDPDTPATGSSGQEVISRTLRGSGVD